MYSKKEQTEKKIFSEDRLYQYCIWLLGRKDYSSFEICEKMKKYQDDFDIIEKTLAKLLNNKFIDDQRLAQNMINRMNLKNSEQKIKQKLMEKKIDSSIIEELLDKEMGTDVQIAYDLLLKKFKTYDKDLWQKYTQFLSYRQFSYDDIKKAIDLFKN